MRYMLLLLLLLNACSSIPFISSNLPSLDSLSVEQQEVYHLNPNRHSTLALVFPLPRGEVGLRGSDDYTQTSARRWLCPQQIHS